MNIELKESSFEYKKQYSERGKFEMGLLDDANEPFPKNPPKYWYEYILIIKSDNPIIIK